MIPQRVVTPGWGAILREAREIRSLTQRELGEIVGMDHSRISQLENEVWQPNLDDIHLLCTALGIWPERILEKLGITLLAGRATKLPVGLVESAADLPAWAQRSLEATALGLQQLAQAGGTRCPEFRVGVPEDPKDLFDYCPGLAPAAISSFRAPQTPEEWRAMYPGEPDRATAHESIDRIYRDAQRVLTAQIRAGIGSQP